MDSLSSVALTAGGLAPAMAPVRELYRHELQALRTAYRSCGRSHRRLSRVIQITISGGISARGCHLVAIWLTSSGPDNVMVTTTKDISGCPSTVLPRPSAGLEASTRARAARLDSTEAPQSHRSHRHHSVQRVRRPRSTWTSRDESARFDRRVAGHAGARARRPARHRRPDAAAAGGAVGVPHRDPRDERSSTARVPRQPHRHQRRRHATDIIDISGRARPAPQARTSPSRAA